MSVRAAIPALLAAVAGCSGASSSPASPPLPCSAPKVAPSRQAGAQVLVAGSGADIAPLRLLARAYRAARPGARVRVAASIGSGGAVRALRDGVIDVGLLSRGLRARERNAAFVVRPLARVALGVVGHRNVALPASLGPRTLARLIGDPAARWPDGRAVVPLVRQASDSTSLALARLDRGLATALARARASRRALVFYTDQAMRDAVVSIPGAVGVLDVGTVKLGRLDVRSAALRGSDGRAPTLMLSLLVARQARRAVRRFVAFATGARAAALLRGAGYAPASRPASRPTSRPSSRPSSPSSPRPSSRPSSQPARAP